MTKGRSGELADKGTENPIYTIPKLSSESFLEGNTA